jgi:hypothetical protein
VFDTNYIPPSSHESPLVYRYLAKVVITQFQLARYFQLQDSTKMIANALTIIDSFQNLLDEIQLAFPFPPTTGKSSVLHVLARHWMIHTCKRTLPDGYYRITLRPGLPTLEKICATLANKITAVVDLMLQQRDIRKHAYNLGVVHTLTTALDIQNNGCSSTDPAISTPSQINFMKSIWCLLEINRFNGVEKHRETLNSLQSRYPHSTLTFPQLPYPTKTARDPETKD